MLESCRHWWRLRNLIRSWIEFREIVTKSLGSAEVSAEREDRFLKVKAGIASQLPHILGEAGPGPIAQESQRQVTMMTDLLNRYRTLRSDSAPSAREAEDFERVWHQHFIYLNKLKGTVRRREAAAGLRGTHAVPSGLPRHKIHRRVPGLGLLSFIVRLGIIALVIYLLGRAFGIRWDASGRFVAQPPTTVGGVGGNVAGGIHSIWSGVLGLMSPVVALYGGSLTIILVVVLLLALGYWIFIRG
ncbi:MAG: hypothetical protein FJY88_00675 [Candidatus Eisenbacteria bacterium]|nr:hypothetical protein [Candidatus Eisenbacteria bacterium]